MTERVQRNGGGQHPQEPRPGTLGRAWAALALLSALSTLLAQLPADWPRPAGRAAGVAVLLVAGVKARVILSRYLGLRGAPGAQRAFDFALALFIAAAAGLYLAAG